VRYFACLIIILVVFSGCRPYPRYRTGEIKKADSEQANTSQKQGHSAFEGGSGKTNSCNLIELGRIIQSYLGTPYKGKSAYKRGMDCSQFTMNVFDRFNKTKLPRTVKLQYKTGHAVSGSKLRFGDLVFFRTDGKSISHTGIYVGHNEFVHASTSSGVRISSIKNKYWKKRFVGGRRILP